MDRFFPHIERRVYRRSFLTEMSVKLAYSRNEDFGEWAQRAIESFALPGNPQISLDDESLLVDSPVCQMRFDPEFCVMAFRPDYFDSFDKVLALIKENAEIFESCCSNKIKSISVGKANWIPAKAKRDDVPGIGITAAIFSENLRPGENRISPIEGISVSNVTETTILCDSYQLEISHGFTSSKSDSSRVFAILNFEAKDARPCAFSTCLKRLQEMNQLIFDAFHWCVSQNLIDAMEGADR